jgi:hypothetical protein
MCVDAPAGYGPGRRAGDRSHLREAAGMFIFFSNRLGCVGSVLVSIVLSVALILAIRSCGPP